MCGVFIRSRDVANCNCCSNNESGPITPAVPTEVRLSCEVICLKSLTTSKHSDTSFLIQLVQMCHHKSMTGDMF